MGSSLLIFWDLVPGSSFEPLVVLLAAFFADVLNLRAHASKFSADGAAGVVGAKVDGAEDAAVEVSILTGAAAPAVVLSTGRFDPLELLAVTSVLSFLGSVPTSSKAICVAFKCRRFSMHAAECT